VIVFETLDCHVLSQDDELAGVLLIGDPKAGDVW
jgi:hypothetical protein